MKQNGLTLAGLLLPGLLLVAQTQTTYTGTNITGQLVLTRTVNPMSLGANRALSSRTTQGAGRGSDPNSADPGVAEPGEPSDVFAEVPKVLRRLHPALDTEVTPESLKSALALGQPKLAFGLPTVTGLPVNTNPGTFGFNGLTHADQRNANSGNQFSTEPPNPSIAVANGYVLLGVNNAIQVYSLLGAPLLPRVLSSNELYGVSPAINRANGINGVFPTDMRVFHDQSINRWFVLQRAQDYDTAGNAVGSSHIYLAVSQTPDPTGTYNIYVIDTTDAANPGCPCVADYPSIGADQYGFYISSNEFNSFSASFINAQVHAISKASLASGAATPVTYRIQLPFTTGYEFAIHPAITPPGASYFVGSNGLQYFVSTQGRSAGDNKLAIFALTNTASLATANPSLAMIQALVTVIPYAAPNVASQRPGTLTYGSTIGGQLAFIDGGDTRIQSASYAGGRLFTTMATAVNDETGRQVVGGGFVILSPTFRGGVLGASVLRQGYVAVRNNHLLRSAIAVNAQGRGAIAATLVGPDYFPSSVYLPITTFSGPASVQLAAPGAGPEDGFTGYPGGAGAGLARWGDYSSPFVASDGSLWMAVQYIPNLPRTQLANWGTFISKY